MDTARTIRVSIDPTRAKTGSEEAASALNRIVTAAQKSSKQARVMQDAMDGVGSSSSNAASKGKRFTTFLDGVSVKGRGLAGILEQNSGLLGKVGDAANDGAGKLGRFASAGRSIIALGLPGVIAGITVAFLAAGAAGISAAAQVEKLQANLLTMLKEPAKMQSAWQALVSFANKTPFSLDQSVAGFTKLRALGLATSEAIMMSYGNTAAAMGKDMSQMIEAVADAVTGEFERLKEFGIKAKQEGSKVAFTFQGITTTVDKNSKAIQDYLVKIGQVNFGGAMARQMDTINGAFANLEDNFFLLMATLGDGQFGQAVKGMTNALADGIGTVTPLVSGLMDIFGGLLNGVWEVAKGVGNLFLVQFGGADGAISLIQRLSVAASFIGTYFSIAGKIVGSVLTFIGQTAGWLVGSLFDLFGDFFKWLTPNFGDAGQSAGEALVGMLRGAEYVANQLPAIFSVALAEVKSMFAQTGAAISKALTGDFSGFDKIDLSFDRTRKVAGRVMQNSNKIYNDRKGNRAWIDAASGITPAGNIDYAALGKEKPNKDKKKADKDAENRAKQQAEFWKGLEQEQTLSKLNTQEREKQAKVFEYQKIVGRDINADESKRLATLLEQTKANAFVTQANEDHRQKMIDLAGEQSLLDKKMAGATEEQLAVEKAALDFAARVKKENLVIDEATLATLTGQVREEAKRSAEIAKQNKLLADGASAAAKYSPGYAKAQQAKEFADQRAGLGALYNGGNNPNFSKAQYDEAIKGLDRAIGDAALESKFRMADAWGATIDDLGDQIGGTFGKAFSKVGRLVQNLVAGAAGNAANAGPLGQIASLLGNDAKDGFKEASKGLLNDLGGLFGNPNSDFAKGIGRALGKASAGMQAGSMVGSGLKALGIKSSGTGASLGGAIGGLTGIPGMSLVGGLVGGVLGGMFKKAKYGTASIAQLAGGELGVSSLNGNKSAYKDNANSAAGSVISGLQEIAASLGATLTGSPSVSIGMYKKDWRVSDTGRTGKLKGKYSDVTDFGDDAEAAVAYAIQVALQDGVLSGISEFSQRVIKASGDTNAIALAQSYESILDSLAAFNNPIKAAVESATKDIDTLAEQMKKAGATSAELANIEQYRSLKLKEILDDQLADFNDTLKLLKGDASGKSAYALLQDDLKEMDKLRATLASGGSVDSATFNNLAQEIIGGAGDVFGTQTKQYQDILGDLTALTQAAIGNATNEFNNAASGAEGTTDAVTTMDENVTSAINTANEWLAQIHAALTTRNTVVGTLTSQNGKLLNAN